MTTAEYEKLKEYACHENQTISQVVTRSLEYLYITDKKELMKSLLEYADAKK